MNFNFRKKGTNKSENTYDEDPYELDPTGGYYSGEEDPEPFGDSQKVSASNGKIALKLVRPESHTDAPKIADQLMSGCIVVLDIDSLERESAIRLIDFLAGVNHVLGGTMKRTNRNTIIVAPNGVNIGDFGLEEAHPAEGDVEDEEPEEENEEE